MAEQALADFFEALRILLGDEGDATIGYDYQDEQLLNALRTPIALGFLPCLSLNEARTGLTEAPAHPDTTAYLIAKAANLMIGGGEAESIRTRSMSVTVLPAAKRERLHHIEAVLEEIESRGNVCGTSSANAANTGLFETTSDFMTRFQTLRIVEE